MDNILVDSLTSTHVYVEKKVNSSIIGNSNINNNGVLEIDSLGNSLISYIDTGDTPLFRLSKYNGNDNLLLVNETTKQFQLASQGDMLFIPLDYSKGIKYYIGAKKTFSTSLNKNVFEVELKENIFKVFLDNGTEITNYSKGENKITVIGADSELIDDFTQLIVYSYEKNSISDNVEFEISYYTYNTTWEYNSFMDGTYFETFIGNEILNFESLNINQDVTKTTNKTEFCDSEYTIINSIKNTADLTVFMSLDSTDIVQYVGTDEFRMILINPQYGRTVIVNNMFLNNGVSLNYEKSKNTKTFNISCGNYIDISVDIASAYGEGRYGKGQYGTGTWVFNSARGEV